MNDFRVYMDQFFFEINDGQENPTLVEIQRIDEPTWIHFVGRIAKDIMLEEHASSVLHERLLNLFRTISGNRYIVELVLPNDFHIPGKILAQWLDVNKFVLALHLRLPENQSDMPMLCDALKRNRTVQTVIFDKICLQEMNLQLLGKALRGSVRIENIKFHKRCSLTATAMIMKDALGQNSHIKSLTLSHFDKLYTINYVNEIENVLSANNSLTSFKIAHAEARNVIPILRGVTNSNITEFDFSSCYNAELHNEVFQMIGNMRKLKTLRFFLRDFRKLSAGLIYTTLKGMYSLNLLTIQALHYSDMQKLKYIMKRMVVEEWQCKLQLICAPSRKEADFFELLRSLQLESLECNDIECSTMHKIADEIPSWKYLKGLTIGINSRFFERHQHKLYGTLFVSAIRKNITLKRISFKIPGIPDFLSVEVKDDINKILARNKQLAECMNNVENITYTKWPEVLVMADPTGINFSYECIRKIPNVFISLFRYGDANIKQN